MPKEIPQVIERLGRAWVLIEKAKCMKRLEYQRDKRARALLRTGLDEKGRIIFKGYVILLSRQIDEPTTLIEIEEHIYTAIKLFDRELYRTMRDCTGRISIIEWKDIVKFYKSGEYDENKNDDPILTELEECIGKLCCGDGK